MGNEATIETHKPFRSRVSAEPDWLYDLRELAWRMYEAAPSPDRVNHLWRYTDPQTFELETGFDPARSGEGRVEAELSSEARVAGVVLLDLEYAAVEHSQLLREHLGALISSGFGKFEALNLALTRAGSLLVIPDNAVLEHPVLLRRSTSGGLYATRLLVFAGANTEAAILDEYTGGGAQKGQINSAVELFAGDASRIRFVTVVHLPDTQSLYLTQRNRIGRDADLQSVTLSINAGLAKINWATELAGRGANSRWAGLLLGDREQHFDMHTSHTHSAGESFSNLRYKVALRDGAMSAYTGRITIEEKAVNCEAYQENRNLLLSDDAHVESIPELEILNDDVKCSHGVTVGPLEEEQLFYFQSRGIARDEAMRIILAGYFEAVLARLPEDYKAAGRELLQQKLMGERRNGGEVR